MTSSEDIREWYHEGVVLNHADRGTPGYEPRCNHNHPTVAFPRSGGVFNEPVHPLCREAFEAYAAVMHHLGVDMPGAGGVNHCRNIGTTDDPSLHAYLCAIDLPPNSFKSATFLAAIMAIRTISGARVFRTLAGDRMHDQIDCSPADLASGIDWTTVIGEDMPLTDEDLQKISDVIDDRIAAAFLPIAIPDEPNRKTFQTMVNAWHAYSQGRKLFHTLDEARNYAKASAEEAADIGEHFTDDA